MEADAALGPASRRLCERALEEDQLAVSAISFWETAMLVDRRRLGPAMDSDSWRRAVLDLGISEIALSGRVGIAAVTLKNLHGDPADRIICATALDGDGTLVTADKRILVWTGALKRHDAGT